ncbi:MAG: bifunctional adenosylcobinamide kinase/adenosylcobinamide-phosphate guanylyltransferase [Frankiaceae bacterium]
MDVVLLGTGASDGLPDAFCRCRGCTAARRSGEWRAQTAALVDGRLLLECGAGVVAAAGRLGVELAGVEHVLVTHDHPDRWQPQVLVGRGRSSAAGRPLDLVGPPAVLARARAAGVAARLRAVRPGERLAVGAYDVRVLAAAHGDESAGPAVLYDVTGPTGSRLLWAPATGPLPAATVEAVTGAAFDAVLLEETCGDGPAHGGGGHHLSLGSFAAAVAELRLVGAITAATAVRAVHLGHGNPPRAELAERLAPWGAQAPDDGARLVLGRPAQAVDADDAPDPIGPAGRRVLVLGGARSGKSAYAEDRLRAEPSVTYVATAPARPDDAEWAGRIAAHRATRPAAWRTLEGADLAAVLADPPPGAVLVDCISLWLASVLDACGAWAGGPAADDAVAARVDRLVAAWSATTGHVVAVSSEVGMGVVPPTPAGRRFRDDLGRLNARLAATADEAWLVTAGLPRRLR